MPDSTLAKSWLLQALGGVNQWAFVSDSLPSSVGDALSHWTWETATRNVTTITTRSSVKVSAVGLNAVGRFLCFNALFKGLSVQELPTKLLSSETCVGDCLI